MVIHYNNSFQCTIWMFFTLIRIMHIIRHYCCVILVIRKKDKNYSHYTVPFKRHVGYVKHNFYFFCLCLNIKDYVAIFILHLTKEHSIKVLFCWSIYVRPFKVVANSICVNSITALKKRNFLLQLLKCEMYDGVNFFFISDRFSLSFRFVPLSLYVSRCFSVSHMRNGFMD